MESMTNTWLIRYGANRSAFFTGNEEQRKAECARLAMQHQGTVEVERVEQTPDASERARDADRMTREQFCRKYGWENWRVDFVASEVWLTV